MKDEQTTDLAAAWADFSSTVGGLFLPVLILVSLGLGLFCLWPTLTALVKRVRTGVSGKLPSNVLGDLSLSPVIDGLAPKLKALDAVLISLNVDPHKRAEVIEQHLLAAVADFKTVRLQFTGDGSK